MQKRSLVLYRSAQFRGGDVLRAGGGGDAGVGDGDCGGLDVEVKGGRWHVIHEQCPNHICANTGWASPEDMIVITCMPNNIVIQVSEYTYETR